MDGDIGMDILKLSVVITFNMFPMERSLSFQLGLEVYFYLLNPLLYPI